MNTSTLDASVLQSLMTPVISVYQLNYYFGVGELHKQVLHAIDLDVKAGEIVIMTGPSGSGKTTLLTLKRSFNAG